MATEGPGSPRYLKVVRTGVDVLSYAAVVAGGATALAVVGGVATGGGLARAKLLLFVVGWLLVSLATVRLWPTSPRDLETGDRNPSVAGDGARTRIETVAAAIPPRRWMRTPAHRVSPPAKLFVAGVLVLLTSLLLEVVFAVE